MSYDVIESNFMIIMKIGTEFYKEIFFEGKIVFKKNIENEIEEKLATQNSNETYIEEKDKLIQTNENELIINFVNLT